MNCSKKACWFVPFVAAVALGTSCNDHRPQIGTSAEIISTTLTMDSYTRARMPEIKNSIGRFYFPTLEIYNSMGILSYQSHDSYHNAQVLQQLATGSWPSTSISDSANLSRVVADIPGFNAKKDGILSRHLPTVLSVSLGGCEGCEFQDSALSTLQARLIQRSVNILIVHVSASQTE